MRGGALSSLAREWRARIRTTAAVIWGYRYDALTLGGAGVIALGVSYVYWPAGVIVAGLVVGLWGVIGSLASRKRVP